MDNLRWKVITIVAVTVIFAAVGVYPIVATSFGINSPRWLVSKMLKLGPRSQGRCPSGPARADRRRAAHRDRDGGGAVPPSADDGRHHHVEHRPGQSDFVQGRGDRARAGRGLPDGGERRQARNFERDSGVNGTYTFSMKPNIQQTLREEAVVQARQTIERRVNELGVAEPSIAQQGSSNDQILVQLPGVSDVNRAKEIIRSTGLLELKIVEQGPSASRRRVAGERSGPERDGNCPGRPGGRRQATCRAPPFTIWCAARRRSPAATCGARARRSTRTTVRRSASR